MSKPKPKRGRWRERWKHAAGAAAETVARCLRVGPGLTGPFLVSYGLWLAWAPLGFIAAGAFLLLADRRIPS
ncbi:hypothetical protein ACIOK4_00200 [Streptomyces bottropensis]|uniref:hypothetical protein n=1 Tax=Streptomyces bottropensis TaxID=42235 RepID=UPI0037FE8D97